jgi:hypothetical protein
MIEGDELDFLSSNTQKVQIKELAPQERVSLSKLKVSKQMKLVSFVPHFQSVPATPQFFDNASQFLDYPDVSG